MELDAGIVVARVAVCAELDASAEPRALCLQSRYRVSERALPRTVAG
jgi:hypothetical protein